MGYGMAEQTVSQVVDAHQFPNVEGPVLRAPERLARIGVIQEVQQAGDGLAQPQSRQGLGGMVGDESPGISQAAKEGLKIFVAGPILQRGQGVPANVRVQVEEGTLGQGHRGVLTFNPAQLIDQDLADGFILGHQQLEKRGDGLGLQPLVVFLSIRG
jgi:hypothetical protein